MKIRMDRVLAGLALARAAHLADRGAARAAKAGFPGAATDAEIARCGALDGHGDDVIINDLIASRQYQTAEAALADYDDFGE